MNTIYEFTEDEFQAIADKFTESFDNIREDKLQNFCDKLAIEFNDDLTVANHDFQDRMSDEDWKAYNALAENVVEIGLYDLAEDYGDDFANAAFSEWETASNSGLNATLEYLNKIGVLGHWNANTVKKLLAIVDVLGY